MKKIPFTISLLLFILLNACSNDHDSNQDGQLNPSERLVQSEIANDNFKTEYSYNSNNLLTSVDGTRSSFTYAINYAYDSNMNVIELEYSDTNGYDGLISFNYNNEGQLIDFQDIVLTYDNNIVTVSGNIEGNENTTITLEMNSDGLITRLNEIDKYTLFQYDINGNLIVASNFDNNDAPLNAFVVEYDTKPNPYYGQLNSLYIERFIEFFYEFSGVYVGGIEGYSFPFLKHNIISVSENNTTVTNYTYTYDSDNYITSVSENSSGNILEFDVIYE